MKKIVSIVIAAAMVFSLAACGSKAAAPAETTAAAAPAAEKKVITIATSPDFPPFESLTSANEVDGIEIAVLKIICEKLGAELKIEQMDFDSVLPGVQAGKFDIGASGISVTEQRKKNVLFTQPYCLAAQAIVVTEGSPIKSKADLDGKKVSVQTGTTAETFCMSEGYDVSAYQANNDAQSALVSGKVDAWVIDDLTAADMVKTFNESGNGKLVILGDAMTTEPYAFALKFGNEELVKQIDEVLTELLSSGKIKEIFDQYGAPYTAPQEG